MSDSSDRNKKPIIVRMATLYTICCSADGDRNRNTRVLDWPEETCRRNRDPAEGQIYSPGLSINTSPEYTVSELYLLVYLLQSFTAQTDTEHELDNSMPTDLRD